eukprot:evm.model.scf_1603.2 EVM.evm.TU.scf_1603.2   scf_1603:12602-17333(-)
MASKMQLDEWARVAKVDPMMVHYGVMIVGVAGSVMKLTARAHRDVFSLSSDTVARSSWVPTGTLLAYRLAAAVFCTCIMVGEMATFGIKEMRFFTQWTFLLLVFYFIVATRSSWMLMRKKAAKGARKQKPRLDAISFFLVVAFHVNLAIACVIDITFWFLMIPNYEANHPDPATREYLGRKFYCLYSYVQHGYNVALLLGDFALNDIPYLRSVAPWSMLWAIAYGIFTSAYHSRTGTWLYPFVDTTNLVSSIYFVCLAASLRLFGFMHKLLYCLKCFLIRASRDRSENGAHNGKSI